MRGMGEDGEVQEGNVYIYVYFHIPLYTFIYLQIHPNTFTYLYIPPYKPKYPILGKWDPAYDPKMVTNQVPWGPQWPYFGMHLPSIPRDAPASPKGVIFN